MYELWLGVLGGESMMYFDEVIISEEVPELSCVRTYCHDCGQGRALELDKFDEIVDGEYVILKDGVTLSCRKCGKVHEGRKILYKARPVDPTVNNIPRCPICGSPQLEKIKTSSKIAAGMTVGFFALPYTSKTFKCKSCGYMF